MKMKMQFAAMAAVVLLVASLVPASGTAATDNVNTPQRQGAYLSLLQGSNVIYAGTMVELTNGVAVPATDNANCKLVGRAEKKSDNTAANYSATKRISVQRGVFRWANSGSFTNTDIGSLAYVADDSSVTNTGNVIAGIIVDVDSDGVWVDTFAIGSQGALSISTFAASGNATVGGTLGVTGNSTLGGTLAVTGTSKLTGATIVVGALSSTGTVTAVNNAAVGGTLNVSGTSTLSNMTVLGATCTIANLPTSTNGLTAGRLWSNSGVITIMQ